MGTRYPQITLTAGRHTACGRDSVEIRYRFQWIAIDNVRLVQNSWEKPRVAGEQCISDPEGYSKMQKSRWQVSRDTPEEE